MDTFNKYRKDIEKELDAIIMLMKADPKIDSKTFRLVFLKWWFLGISYLAGKGKVTCRFISMDLESIKRKYKSVSNKIFFHLRHFSNFLIFEPSYRIKTPLNPNNATIIFTIGIIFSDGSK